jgi:hypothetical protein
MDLLGGYAKRDQGVPLPATVRMQLEEEGMKIAVEFIPSDEDLWKMDTSYFEENGNFPGEFSPSINPLHSSFAVRNPSPTDRFP